MPAHTYESILDGLFAAGVRAGDALIVHASMRAIGQVSGGADTVLDAIGSVIGPEGTLLIPAFSQPDAQGVFDVRSTPSRLGVLSERFRLRARRSLHPTHSVCALAKSIHWLDGHETRAGLGVGSPLHHAADVGARVLMIGCGMTACSSVHIAESIERVPYLGKVWFPGYDRSLTIVGHDGLSVNWSPIDPPTCSDGFGVVEAAMDREGLVRHARIGDAPCLVFTAADCINVARGLLRRDASSLLCDRADCAVCPDARRIVSTTL